MSCYVMLCHVMSCYAMLCYRYIMLCWSRSYEVDHGRFDCFRVISLCVLFQDTNMLIMGGLIISA